MSNAHPPALAHEPDPLFAASSHVPPQIAPYAAAIVSIRPTCHASKVAGL